MDWDDVAPRWALTPFPLSSSFGRSLVSGLTGTVERDLPWMECWTT